MCLESDAKFDSTFVKNCVRFLYKDSLHVLKYKTVSKYRGGKTPMTPEKKNIVAAALKYRLDRYKDELGVTEIAKRSSESKINEHLQNAIQNTVKFLNSNGELPATTTTSTSNDHDENRAEMDDFDGACFDNHNRMNFEIVRVEEDKDQAAFIIEEIY